MRCHGRSLLSLLVTLSLAATLTTLALPDFVDWVRGYRAQAAVAQLSARVTLARHAAVRLNRRAVVCSSAGSGCLGRNEWHRGALVFVDADRDRQWTPDEPVVGRFPPLRRGVRVYWRAFRNRSALAFTPRGLTAWQNGHFLYCPADGEARYARQLVLNVGGRLRVSRDADADGVHEDVQGRPLACPG